MGFRVYKIDITRAWLARVAPVLTPMLKVLSFITPLAKKLYDVTHDAQATEERLDFALEIMESLGKVAGHVVHANVVDTDLVSEHHPIRADGADLREFQQILLDADPQRRFGGLVRVRDKQGKFAWVHPDFAGDYGVA